MRRIVCGLVLLLWLGCGSTPPRRLVIDAGWLFDGTPTPPRENQRLVVEDGGIVAVSELGGEGPPEPEPGTLYVDARQSFVMPGLVDAHNHLYSDGGCDTGGGGLGAAVTNLHALLQAGVTTAADLAAPLPLAVGLRAWAGTGRQRGPRVLVAGPMLTAPGGYMTDVDGGKLLELGVVREVATPEVARREVQDLATGGVDLIKVGLQGESYEGKPLPMMAQETLCALVDEAHTQDLRVVAHAIKPAGWELGLACGVDAFVHGLFSPAPVELLSRVAAAKLPVAPTLQVYAAAVWGPAHAAHYQRPDVQRALNDDAQESIARFIAEASGGGSSLPQIYGMRIPRADAEAAIPVARENLVAMARAGVPLALGTDSANCLHPAGVPWLELLAWEQAGLGRLEALSAATSGSARLLGLGEAIGRLHVGYRADMIVVSGRPDLDLEALTRVERVVLDGIEQEVGDLAGGRTSLLGEVVWAWLKG